VITTTGLELRAGARILISDATLRVQPGDRIGLVGRNGAGKTTTLTTLAGDRIPHAGKVDVSGELGYLPQDPRSGDLDITASDRVLSGRGLDVLRNQLVKAQVAMAEPADDDERDKAVRRYGRLEDQFAAMGGYAAESDAARICTNLGLPDRVLAQPLRTLSGGQRRRVELDEPTNHLDADSITWLRGFLSSHRGGLIVISHDVELLEAVVNKVWHLDANRATVDIYNLGWKRYLQQRETDERRRKQERANTERKIDTLTAQADKMRAKATKAKAAKSMDKRAERLASGLADVRVHDKVAKLRFPTPVACGRTPLMAEGLSKSYGSLEIFTDVDLAVDKGTRVVVLGLNGAGKTTLLRMLAGTELPDTGEIKPGHGLRVGYYAQEHETIDMDRTLIEVMRSAAPDSTDTELRRILGAFLFSGETVDQRAGTLSGGERTRLAMATLVVSGANVLLLDEPTNNLDPASREQVLEALRTYAGAIVLVTHDEGAVHALKPDKVILLPDGTEDAWSEDFADLVSLA
jgi:ATPase subunit of ABC transporter with duplicated ATPase domains